MPKLKLDPRQPPVDQVSAIRAHGTPPMSTLAPDMRRRLMEEPSREARR